MVSCTTLTRCMDHVSAGDLQTHPGCKKNHLLVCYDHSNSNKAACVPENTQGTPNGPSENDDIAILGVHPVAAGPLNPRKRPFTGAGNRLDHFLLHMGNLLGLGRNCGTGDKCNMALINGHPQQQSGSCQLEMQRSHRHRCTVTVLPAQSHCSWLSRPRCTSTNWHAVADHFETRELYPAMNVIPLASAHSVGALEHKCLLSHVAENAEMEKPAASACCKMPPSSTAVDLSKDMTQPAKCVEWEEPLDPGLKYDSKKYARIFKWKPPPDWIFSDSDSE